MTRFIQFVAGTSLMLLCACANPPAPTAAAHIDSGINANNGGGMNSTGGIPNTGVTTPVR